MLKVYKNLHKFQQVHCNAQLRLWTPALQKEIIILPIPDWVNHYTGSLIIMNSKPHIINY
jgi:hypothetical protein